MAGSGGRWTSRSCSLAGSPRPSRPGEIAVDQIAAASLHLHVGSTLAMMALPNPQPGQHARPHRLAGHVVGVFVTQTSVSPATDNDAIPFILASRALWHQLGPDYLAFGGAFVRLRPGATAGRVSQDAQALAHRFPSTGGQVIVADESAQVAATERSIHPQAVTLALFALVLACAAVLIVGQVAARLLVTAGADHPVLNALGMTRGQLLAAGLAEVAVAGAAGAVLAVGVAVAASPLMPIGTARLAEPDPGVSADWPVLTGGAVLMVVLLVARSGWPAWRLTAAQGLRTPGVPGAISGHRSRLAGWLARTGAPVTMTAGVQLAFEPGRGRTAVPVRAALGGTALSVLAVTAAFTFGASLLTLVHTPRLYGQDWDAALDLQFSAISRAEAARFFGTDPAVAGWTFGDHGILAVGGQVVPAIGLAPGRGPLLSPTLLAGRPVRTSREIVLGSSTLRRLGLRVGQQVTVVVSGQRMRDRIVGRAVFPNFGQGSFTPTDLGQGAETTAAVFRAQAAAETNAPGYEVVLLRLRGGPPHAAAIARLRRSVAHFCAQIQQSTCLLFRQPPAGVTDYARIDGTPEVLAGALAVLGVAALAQLAVISSRRRRRDFAILKVLGLLRRQVSEITAWQVSTLAAASLLIGLPLGIATGRWAWLLFSTGLGIPADPRAPVALVLLMIPAVFLIANVVALWPGRSAARVRPAHALRTE